MTEKVSGTFFPFLAALSVDLNSRRCAVRRSPAWLAGGARRSTRPTRVRPHEPAGNWGTVAKERRIRATLLYNQVDYDRLAQPILTRKVANSGEFLFVVGHDRTTKGQRVSRD